MPRKKKIKEKINPFDNGVSYKDFSKALGTEKIEDYLKGICDESQIEWIKIELINFKNK
jgi:predicted lipoprotein